MLRTALALAVTTAALPYALPPATAAQRIERVVATPAFHHAQEAVASKDGRFVAVVAYATTPLVVAGQLAPNSGNAPVVGPSLATPIEQVYVVDRIAHKTRLISATKNGTPADKDAFDVAISADGRYVTFASAALNLAGTKPPPGGARAGYLFDRATNAMSRVSLDWHGAETGVSSPGGLMISADGSTIVFVTGSAALKGEKAGGGSGIFARDRRTGRLWAVSRTKAGAVARSYSLKGVHVSRTGRYVTAISGNWLGGGYGPEASDTYGNAYLFDTKTGTARVVRGATTDDVRCPQQAFDAKLCAYVIAAVAVDAEGTRFGYAVATDANVFGVPTDVRIVSVDLLSGQLTVLATPADAVGGLAYSTDGGSLYFVAPPVNNESVTGAQVLYRGTIATRALGVITRLPAAAACRTDGCATVRIAQPAPIVNGVVFATDAPLVDGDTDGLMDAYVSTG